MKMLVEITEAESVAITNYCNAHGYKKGRWIKRIMFNEIAKASGQGDGSQQARDMAATIGGMA